MIVGSPTPIAIRLESRNAYVKCEGAVDFIKTDAPSAVVRVSFEDVVVGPGHSWKRSANASIAGAPVRFTRHRIAYLSCEIEGGITTAELERQDQDPGLRTEPRVETISTGDESFAE